MVPRDMAVVALAAWTAACGSSPIPSPTPSTPSAACGAPSTPAWAIQGRGPRTPLEGREVAVEGIVVGDYEGPAPALRGFYLQDPEGDGDGATSDAVFVFNGDRDDVRAGDRVRVRGAVEEVQGQTQVTREESGTSLEICGRDGSVSPVDVGLPVASPASLERVEGMLVRFPDTLHVTDHYHLGRFGEVALSAGGRLPQPTDVAEPGAAARAVQEANDRSRILLDDAHNGQNPDPIPFGRGGDPLTARNTLRGGDRVAGLVGVMTWGWAGDRASGNAWRVRPLHALGGGPPVFEPANARPGPPAVEGSTRVGAFNVLNYFDTFEGCRGGKGGEPTDCRGADGPAELERQWRKTVAAITAMDADILAIVEMENDGYGPESAIAHLVQRLNAATDVGGRGPWAFVDVDAATGRRNALGTDAIKVGFLYRPDQAVPVGTTAVLSTPAFVTGGDSLPRNRPSLAQAFQTPESERLVVVANHLKSKGSPCDADVPGGPGSGEANVTAVLQGSCDDVRTAAARELARWLGQNPTATGEPDVLILGDLNAYTMEDPVRTLVAAGYIDLMPGDPVGGGYTYVFDGHWGTLDRALASPSLASQVTEAVVWHINADEPPVLGYETDFKSLAQRSALYAPDPYRSSDHDPVVVGLELGGG